MTFHIPIDRFTDAKQRDFQIAAIHKSAATALKLVVREFKRLELYGCQKPELETHVKIYRLLTLTEITDEPTTSFASITEDFVSLFLDGIGAFDKQSSFIGTIFLLDQLKHEDLNREVQKCAKLMADFQQQDVSLQLLSSSEDAKVEVVQLKALLEDPALYDQVEQLNVSTSDEWLTCLKDSLKPTSPIKSQELSAIKAYSWSFANQIEVVYKPMTQLMTNMGISLIIPNGRIQQFKCLCLREMTH